MHKTSPSQISLYKSLLKHTLNTCPKPSSPFPISSLSTIPTQLGPNSVPSSNPKFSHISNSNSHDFRHPLGKNLQIYLSNHLTRYSYGTESVGDSVPDFDQNTVVDLINLKFAEAREEIEMAMESKETVYFDEEAECARAAVKEVLDMFEKLLKKLPETKKAALQRSMGLKIEQLKAELQQLDD
ncbi:hypothetical protein CFOL_v3_01751 [Cephalotus follicularis]|uniref:Uncharacterized protein n=1 Tax=Cephalotus follicularis TaxID=3775 RepID=A0A1Q3AR44_CEPFO|nr:hypothetical protein CFOL_v3_01751 [Cephalotus follicularis]